MVLGITATLTIQNIFFKPDPPDTTYLKMKLKELEKNNKKQDQIIYRNINSIIDRNERLTKDSLDIMSADRRYRDSLRNVLNPPD